jgi:hypothetical protein
MLHQRQESFYRRELRLIAYKLMFIRSLKSLKRTSG